MLLSQCFHLTTFLWFIRTLHSIGVFHDQARGGHISSVSTIPRYGFKIFHFMGTNAPSQAECQIQPPTQCRIRLPWWLLYLTDQCFFLCFYLSCFLYLKGGGRTNIPADKAIAFLASYIGKTNCFIKMAKHSLNCPSLSELGSIIRRFPRAKKRQLWWDTGWAKWSSSVETVDEKPHMCTRHRQDSRTPERLESTKVDESDECNIVSRWEEAETKECTH